MGNIFLDQPEFISADPRRDRPNGKGIGYKVTPEFMLLRHESLLPKKLIEGRKILDLGSCTGASGAWCLSQGAAFYKGVELNEEFARQSSACLSKYYEKERWCVEQRSIEDFLELADEKFDIILASGIVYGSADPIKLLTQMSEKAERVVIESVHQHVYLRMLPRTAVTLILNDPQSIFSLENTSYITVGQQGMIGTGQQTLIFNGLNPSMGALKFLFRSLGFAYNDIVNQALKKLPETYHPLYRFGMLFEKDKHAKVVPYGFVQTIENPESKKVYWQDL